MIERNYLAESDKLEAYIGGIRCVLSKGRWLKVKDRQPFDKAVNDGYKINKEVNDAI